MDIKDFKLPKAGDSDAYKVEIWSEGELQFSLFRKISGTELAICFANGIVMNREEALKKLRAFTVSEATGKYNSGKYKIGEIYEGFYSPGWPIKN